MIEYQKVRVFRDAVLRQAFQNFKPDSEYTSFEEEMDWLEPYAVFRAFKEANALKPWNEWPQDERDYPLDQEVDLTPFEEEIRYHKFLQFILFKQWKALKQYANEKGIQIMGDIPFYVGHDSADCWNARSNFLLTKDGEPRFIAGVPPDYFAVTGQRWGNPIYDWEYMKSDEFGFWLGRIGYSMELFDIIRLDHFRAFDTYWKIPASCPIAMEGEWIEAPGVNVFDKLLAAYPSIQIVAEDLGDLRPEVLELRDQFAFPGMHVLIFEFRTDTENRMNPHSILYTGTHDNQTIRALIAEQKPADRRHIYKWLNDHGYKGDTAVEKMLSFAMQSEPETVIVPAADWLGASS